MEPLLGSGMGMCRCCATEGSFKGLTTKFIWMGEEEVYFDMLRDCFDVTLPIPDEGPEGGICEVCITQLRNAANFKRQVLNTEEQFQRLLQRHAFRPKLVKEELTAEPDEDDIPLSHLSEEDRAQSDGFSSPEYDLPIKSEKEPKRKRKAASRKPKAEPETSAKQRRTSLEGLSEGKLTLNKRTNFSAVISIRPSRKAKTSPERVVQKQRRLTELDLHFDNIKTVIRCSNATPLRCEVGDRYACGYCLDQYQDPRELKQHTLKKHKNSDEKLECLSIRSLARYSVNLDITLLKCNICEEDFEQLDELIEHLKGIHEEPIHSNIRNLMVPYKFEDSELRCAFCGEEFAHFWQLQEHMPKHCRNYVCEFCDEAFIMKFLMIDHKKKVHHV